MEAIAMPSRLGGRSTVVVTLTGRQTKILQFVKFLNSISIQSMFRLFECIYGVNSFVPIDIQPVFEGNAIVRLFFQRWEAIYSLSIPTSKYYHT